MSNTTWRKRLRWPLMATALLALGWTIWLLWGSLPELRRDLPRLHASWLLWTLLGNTLAGYLGFEAFRALFERVRPSLYSRVRLAHLYFTGQLMKHLPGRVWGIAYQTTTGGEASLGQWISVNAGYMLLTTAFALWVSATTLSFILAGQWGWAMLFCGAFLYHFGWHRRSLEWLSSTLGRLPGKAIARLQGAISPFMAPDLRFKVQVLFWFAASWLAYLLAWGCYGLAWPGLNFGGGVALCAIYTLAWFVGYVSLISPSGVGIRELVFVLLAHRFPADAVAGMAVLGRVTLLIVDVILGVLFAPFRRAKTMKHANLPQFDERGNNIADPRDKSGRKMAYITQVHRFALARYVGRGPGMALDLGCGYGRITRALECLGWTTIGIEPSRRILLHAFAAYPGGIWCLGGLPDLPFSDGSFDLILAQNLLRPLHLSGMLDIVRTKVISNALRPGGRFVVVDNIWVGNPKFVSNDWIMSTFSRDGLKLTQRVPIRSARWWGIFAIRFGLVPDRWTERLAAYELRRMTKMRRAPSWRYYNVLYVFEKT